MEEKKTAKANLEYERTTFLLLGFVVALSTLFVVLEWENTQSLSPDWAGFSPLFIEQESAGIADVPPEETSPPKAVEVAEEQPVTVSEEFNVIEKVQEEVVTKPEEEIIDTIPAAPETVTNMIYEKVEIMPQFKGGYTALIRFIYNTVEYPANALKQRIAGRVWCSFIVDKDGSISDVRLEQGVYSLLNEEALRVLRIMPAWEPGVMGGKPVKVKVYLPVVFKL
ncbi:MAG: TonB family protein [Dysgonamonadaceae bacterium]|jgi:protein TonB|nr:TonB family protein [Dysgonamonadaceae bacterium]